MPLLTHYRYKAMENIVRKGEVACNKQFLLFLSMFSTLYGTYFSFQIYFHMSSVICFSLDQPKILSSGNGLNSEQRRFQPYFSYIAATSAPVHAFLEVFFFFFRTPYYILSLPHNHCRNNRQR